MICRAEIIFFFLNYETPLNNSWSKVTSGEPGTDLCQT